jgi:hypothetical protein
MKSKKTHSEAETTISFWLPKDLAVKAWNMAAIEGISFNAYVLRLLLKDAKQLADAARLKKERKDKVLKFPKQQRRRP